MANAVLAIILSARDTASPVLKKAREELGGWKAAAAVAGAAATAMGGAMADLAREGAADVAALEAVKVAVTNAGGSWEESEGAISSFINRMRDTGAVADDKMKPALASLISVTQDYEKSMQLASLAADISRGKHIDLETAATLVGKVAQGNTSALTRYGIVLQEGATAQEALAELQKRFAGQAEAYGKTTQGQLETLRLRIGDFREDLGSAINEISPFIGLLPGLSAGYSALGGAVGVVTKAYGANTIANIAHKAASVATTIATTAMTAAQWLLNTALSANPIGVIIMALAALTAGVVWAYQNIDFFRDVVNNTFSWLRDNAIPILLLMLGPLGGIAAGFKWAYDNIAPFRDIVDATVGAVQRLLSPLRDLLDLIGRIPTSIGLPSIPSFSLPSIPGFAAGGIVPGAIGAPRLIMAHGGETVIPARGGAGINVYVTVQGSVMAERDLAEAIRRELILVKNRNVTTGL